MKRNYENTEITLRQAGFSLIELLVSMVIFVVIVSSLYGLLKAGSLDRNSSSRRTDVLKNARVAIHMIGRDALNAGLGYNRSGALVPDNFTSKYLGSPNDKDGERDLLTAISGGDNVYSNILMENTTDQTDTLAFAFRDTNFNGGNLISLSDSAATSGNAQSVTITTAASAAANTSVFDMYLIESQSSQVAAMLTDRPVNTTNKMVFTPGDPIGINQALNGTGEDRSPLKKCATTSEEDCLSFAATTAKRFYWVIYSVKADGTLVRKSLGNNVNKTSTEQVVEMPIAYNVRDFQVKYLLEDGRTVDNPLAGADGKLGTTDDTYGDFNLVRQISLTIKVLSTENDERTKKPEIITLQATFSTRNLKYDVG